MNCKSWRDRQLSPDLTRQSTARIARGRGLCVFVREPEAEMDQSPSQKVQKYPNTQYLADLRGGDK